MRPRLASIWLAAVVVAGLAPGAVRGQSVQCPDLYPVHLSKPAPAAINVLFLPDAFTVVEDDPNTPENEAKNELPAYRCAVQRMVRGLLTMQPFRNLGCHFNFYRMDTRSSYDDVQWYWDEPKCHAADSPWPTNAGDCPDLPGTPPDALLQFDPNAQVCPLLQDNPVYNTLMLPDASGQQAVLDIAEQCAPEQASFNLIVILVDTEHPAGGALPGTIPPISVVPLDDITTHAPFYKLAHETGHTLLLHDEYEDGFNPDLAGVTYAPGRNLWRACDVAEGHDIPWKAVCDPPPAQGSKVRDCAGQRADSSCRVVCTGGVGDNSCGVSEPPPWPTTGLYEGGFYSENTYFRASEVCLMSQIGKPFCAGCRCFVTDLLQSKLGLAECSTPSACGPQPEHDILMRDCPQDYGARPSDCRDWGSSPDLQLTAVALASLTVRACVTNIGNYPIPGSAEIAFRFTVADRLPNVKEIIAGREMPPVVHKVKTLVRDLDRDIFAEEWQVGERRCVEVKLRITDVSTALAIADLQPGFHLYALALLRDSKINRDIVHVKQSHLLTSRKLEELLTERP